MLSPLLVWNTKLTGFTSQNELKGGISISARNTILLLHNG